MITLTVLSILRWWRLVRELDALDNAICEFTKCSQYKN